MENKNKYVQPNSEVIALECGFFIVAGSGGEGMHINTDTKGEASDNTFEIDDHTIKDPIGDDFPWNSKSTTTSNP